MRVAYLIWWRGNRATGPFRKMAAQAAAWSKLGVEVGLFVATSPAAADDWRALPEAAGVFVPPTGPFAKLRERRALVDAALAWGPDLVYERRGLWFPGIGRVTRRMPTVVEVNEDDVAVYRLATPPKYAYNRLTRGFELGRAKGLVFVSDELARSEAFAKFRQPRVVIGNAIDFAAYPEAAPPPQGPVRLVFVGHADSPWHGVAQLAELAAALPDFPVDVVGKRPDEFAAIPPNMTVHGELAPEAVLPLLASATVGVGSLAMDAVGLTEGSPLKVREYLASGLPVVIGYRDTDFPEPVDFVLRLPTGPDVVRGHVEEIRSFVERWHGRRVPRTEVAHLDVGVKEAARVAFLAEVLAQTRG